MKTRDKIPICTPAKFDIPEGDNAKKRSCQRWQRDGGNLMTGNQKMILRLNMVLMQKIGLDLQKCGKPLGIRKKAQEIKKYNDSSHLLSRGGYELLEKKLMDEKRKTREEQVEFTKEPSLYLPPSPISRHMKWKMANTKQYGQMTSTTAKEIVNKIGNFVPSGRDDFLNTAIGRPEHSGRVRVAGTGVTISQYFVPASHRSTTSSNSIKQENIKREEAWLRRVEEEKQRIMDSIKGELKQAIKLELSQIASQQSPPLQAHDIQLLAARVSTKGSCAAPEANAIGKKTSNMHGDSVGLHVIAENGIGQTVRQFGTIHNVPYADDVAQDAKNPMNTPFKIAEEDNALVLVDLLGDLVKNLLEIYQKPIDLSWDGTKFGIDNVKDVFFITHTDVTEIILGDNFLNISILQLWLMFMHDLSTSIGYGALYGFLEPQCIHNAKNKREKSDAAIKATVNSAMKSLNKTEEGKPAQPVPQWIEAKSHVQTGNYECGYYVMHWIWCIVTGGLKDEWIRWFSDGTALTKETMTTLWHKWAGYFLQMKNSELRKI
ncbi:hypothetical protein HKD37_18G050772 [Glycine soja]